MLFSLSFHLFLRRTFMLFALGIVFSCSTAKKGLSADPNPEIFTNRSAFEQYVVEGRDSPFGLDYVFVHNPGARDQELVDEVCETMPIRWVNLTRLEWKILEPRAPQNGRHAYNWRNLDDAVQAWQRNGVHIMISARFASPWATAPRNDDEFVYLEGVPKQVALLGADYLPKPEHADDFRDYVRNLVERYDGDGRDDMPGLLFPVLHYQVGNEYYNELFWAGSSEDYGRLLREFARSAREACSDVQVILSGTCFRTVPGFYDLEPDPRSQVYINQRMPHIPQGMREFVNRSETFSRETAAMVDDYDILDARWPNYGIVAESRDMLRECGTPDRPIWSAEIYSGYPLPEQLTLPNWTLQAQPAPSRSLEYLRVLKNKDHADFDEVNGWYRGLQAAQVVKLSMVGLDAGSEKLMMGWAVDIQSPLAVSTLSHHGLYSLTFERCWPAAYTYALTIRQLEGLTSIDRLPMPENIYVYRCEVKGGKEVLVAFCDDHIGQNHDEPTATMQAVIPFDADQARAVRIITEIGETEPEVVEGPVENNRLRIRLSEYPVFIEAL